MMRKHAHTMATSALALLMTFCLVAPVAAQDDAGGRSVLADGAGNRALSMGGAYAAVADDASAVIWNPGGLGLVQRREFQASHTNLMGMGFNEQYLSFVLPDWRWGVGSFTFRRFGVGGIEGRDDRNLLTSDDLSNSETELTLGYGREIGAAWSLGGSLKLRKQSLAGYSDSGVGIDLGAVVRPLVAAGVASPNAPNLTLGLSVRNLVEPALRLDQEPVKDPTGFRVGGAYHWNFGREGKVLLAVDVEKTRDMNTHLHAGAEVTVVRPLDLRLGLNNGRFVAGAGVYYNAMGIDYQFEDHPLGYFHRFGVAVKFGLSQLESRTEAMALDEAELQHRLGAAFDGQQQQRKMELLAKAQTAVRQEDTEAAANYLAMLKVLDPDAPELDGLEAQVLVLQAAEQEKAGDYAAAMVSLRRAVELDPNHSRAAFMLARIREAGDLRQQRTAEIRGLLDAALDDFATGDLLAARQGFQQVLTLAPDDREAQSMLARTEVAITTRVKDHLDQVRILANAGEFDRANSELAAARRLDPEAQGLDLAASYLADAKVRELTAPKTETARPTVAAVTPGARVATAATGRQFSDEELRELEDLYWRGVNAMEQEQMDKAVHYWELVWSLDADYKNVTDYLGQHYLARGMEYFVAGALTDAVASWENAVRVNPDDPKANGYLQRAREQAERMRMMDD